MVPFNKQDWTCISDWSDQHISVHISSIYIYISRYGMKWSKIGYPQPPHGSKSKLHFSQEKWPSLRCQVPTVFFLGAISSMQFIQRWGGKSRGFLEDFRTKSGGKFSASNPWRCVCVLTYDSPRKFPWWWLEDGWIMTFYILEMSSSQLTNSIIFQDG